MGDMETDWLTLALGVLPAPPVMLTAARAEGGDVGLRLTGSDEHGLLVEIDALDAEETSAVTVALEPADRGEYALVGRLEPLDRAEQGMVPARLTVEEVLRWKKRPRMTLDVPATVALVHGAAGSERSAPASVRLIDLAPQGVAFAAADGYRRGDRLRLGATVGDQQLLVEARVLQVGRPVFGRCRVSCTFAGDPLVDALLADAAGRAA
jgi:hypothetical protein